jgi:probable F420-dependent oxidoreductase
LVKISAVIGMWLDRPAEEALLTASLADRLGYGELWIGEMATWDTFALATAVGLATDQIDLTVGPLPVTVRDPAMIAMGAASVAALTRRKVGIALGTSSTTVVRDWHGRSMDGAAAALADSAKAVATLLKGDRHGKGFRLRLDPPTGPLTVAAFGDKAIETAARYADRMVINLVSPELAATLRTKLDEAAAKHRRPAPRLAAWVPAAVDPSAEAYVQLVRGLVPYLAAPGYRDMFTAAGFGDAVRLATKNAHPRELLTALPPEIAGAVGLVGDAGAVATRLRDYEKAGVDEVAIVPATGGDSGGERTLGAIRDLLG